jgi:hypothetical protein
MATTENRKERETRIVTDAELQQASKLHAAISKAKLWESILVINNDETSANNGKVNRTQTAFLLKLAIDQYVDENPDLKPLRGLAAVHGAKESNAPKYSNSKIWKIACEVFDTLSSKQVRKSLDGKLDAESVTLNGLIRNTAKKLGANELADDGSWEQEIARVKNAFHIKSKTNEGAFKDLGDVRSPIIAFTEKGPGEKFAFRKTNWKDIIDEAPDSERDASREETPAPKAGGSNLKKK